MSAPETCPDCGAELPAGAAPGTCPKCLMKLGFESNPGSSAEGESADQVAGLTQEALQQLFPELEILKCVGSGGMGVVWKVRQKHLDRPAALKILRDDSGKDPAFAERFTREARAMARLSHPAIIGVYDFGQRDQVYFLLMEFVDGSNLRNVVREGHLSPQEALAIVPQICDALQYAHDEGVVHRDIKPENILIDVRGRVRIADFGLAKLLNPDAADFTLTGTRQVMGTPHYMAPEQTEHPQDVDHRADIYSLGVVFYEMLTGELPLGRFDPPSKLVEVDVRLDEVVLRALEKEPARRYQQAADVRTDVQTVVDSANHSGKSSVEALLPALNLSRHGIIAAGLFACAAIDAVTAISFILMGLFDRNDVRTDELMFGMVHLIGIVVAAGAFDMWTLRSHRGAMLGAIAAVVPLHYGAILGIPFGLSALYVLTRPNAAAQFRQAGHSRATLQTIADTVQPTIVVIWHWIRSGLQTVGQAVLNRRSSLLRFGRATRHLFLWTVACLLIFASAMLLVARYGTWNITVDDRTAGVIVSDVGGIQLLATGEIQRTGAFRGDTFPGRRETLHVFVRPSAAERRSTPKGHLIVSMDTLNCVDGNSGREWGDVSSATFASWLRSLDTGAEEAAISREAVLLANVADDVARDPELGVSYDRSLVGLVSRHGRRTQNYSLRGPSFHVSPTPSFFSTAVAVVFSVGLWLAGMVVIALGSVTSGGSEVRVARHRWARVFVPGSFAALWTIVCALGHHVLRNWLPTALAQEFPSEFSPGSPNGVMVADILLVIAWIVGLLVIVMPSAVLRRLRSGRRQEASVP